MGEKCGETAPSAIARQTGRDQISPSSCVFSLLSSSPSSTHVLLGGRRRIKEETRGVGGMSAADRRSRPLKGRLIMGPFPLFQVKS